MVTHESASSEQNVLGIAVSMIDVDRTYGDGPTEVAALRAASLEVHDGEIVALIGPSGSGKTTLLNCLVGLDAPDDGAITALGVDVRALSYEDAVVWRREQVAIVFQATALLSHLTARENIDIVLRIRGVDRAERQLRTRELLEALQIGELADHLPGELSGGQQQRVSLARALATRPALLVADEPTGQLDSDTTQVVLAELRRQAEAHGITMLLATHDHDVEGMADRSVHMRDGRIAGSA